jgi:hypothetical protein
MPVRRAGVVNDDRRRCTASKRRRGDPTVTNLWRVHDTGSGIEVHRRTRRRGERAGIEDRVNVQRSRSGREADTGGLGVLEELEALRDLPVALVELGGTHVGIDGVRNLVVAALVETAEVEPDLRNVRVDSDSS